MKVQIRLSCFVVASLLVLVFLSSCGSTNTTNTGASGGYTGSSSQATTAPNKSDTSKDYGKGSSSTPAVSTAGSVVKTASATVDGKAVTILTNTQGMTLYYFKPDTASKTACTAACASTWPPLLFTNGKPTAAGQLPGELEIYPNANGKQVIYNDHPLYTYSGDTAAGQTNGQGIGGVWFVVTPDIAKNQP